MSPRKNLLDPALPPALAAFQHLPDMPAELDRLVAQIPAGRVSTYGALARALGDIAAAKWIGGFLADHDHTPACACHRVLRIDGSLGVYGSERHGSKADRLRAEGVAVSDGRVGLTAHALADFNSTQPLVRLKAIQETLHATAAPLALPDIVRLVGGVDVSYTQTGHGAAACVVYDTRSGERIAVEQVIRPAPFPYITGYLSFREIPLHLEAIAAVSAAGCRPDVLLVDGSGQLHPRGAGVATHLGMAVGIPTVGVSKKLLCGTYDQTEIPANGLADIQHAGRVAGAALLPRTARSKPLFVSPGWGMSVPQAIELVERWLLAHRLPEPIYDADRLSRAAARNDAAL